jgi:CubicO group peptidase (beta-lactamase class C family)
MSDPIRADSLDRRSFIKGAAGIVGIAAAIDGHAAVAERDSVGEWTPPSDFLKTLPGLMRLACLPGMSIATVEKGTVNWVRTFGVSNAQTAAVLTQETLFEAASMSKPVFAYAVLKLVEQGKLDLDLPLARYFRPPYLPTDPRIDRITARHALSHTSGLPNWGNDADANTLRPEFDPGQFFSYSGEGYFWLQLVIENITGQGLDAFMRSQLFNDAGMSHSMFACDEEQLASLSFGHSGGRSQNGHGLRGVAHLLTPYARKWGKPIRDWMHEDWIRVGTELNRNDPPVRVRFQNAAGSLLTTATDYAKFVALFADRRTRASWELDPKLSKLLITPHVALQRGEPFSWGLGWGVEHGPAGTYFAHEGNNENVFTSFAIGDHSRGLGLVILANDGAGYGVLQRVVRASTRYDPYSFVANTHPPHAY